MYDTSRQAIYYSDPHARILHFDSTYRIEEPNGQGIGATIARQLNALFAEDPTYCERTNGCIVITHSTGDLVMQYVEANGAISEGLPGGRPRGSGGRPFHVRVTGSESCWRRRRPCVREALKEMIYKGDRGIEEAVMSLKAHLELMAEYNQWMNEKVYSAAGQLSSAELAEDRGAFFRSVLGTLNHLVVGDRIWLNRFAMHPPSTHVLSPVSKLPHPTSLDQILFEEFDALREHRQWLDEVIIHWVSGLNEADMDFMMSFRNTKGVARRMKLSPLIGHFFNHQTHHRGQLTTLLSQAGQDVGVTDLFALIPNELE